MTNKQTAERLEPGTVVRAGLELLDDKGLDALSIRAVAHRLGVRMNTVLWHVKTKARMLELMADAVVGEIPLDALPDAPDERVRELARRYRRALLAHRDGAALVVGTYVAEPHTLRLAETFVAAFLDSGRSEREAAWTVWTVLYFTLGLTQEEQAAQRQSLGDRLAESLSPTAHPGLHRTLGYLAGGSFDERFEFGLAAILGRG
ncbi:TetR family transcriptional regulator [Streptomyces sp. HNM0575]|uniref:TetR/AcrR family transcriptional regulator C-terminal domain-containing protein n=1 Tax=Streptomyces sp. HNM0575 TaxID=2716338 RepID=UPI00145FB0A6|nr:TetR/AcrR family transcriptional regulator C-terminal domain-containing protein [Streptomyces sp. HNM0575]NLU76662.1 TetR family transcriptional regulator [Streptomyces sp. HNM0575]